MPKNPEILKAFYVEERTISFQVAVIMSAACGDAEENGYNDSVKTIQWDNS